MPADEPRTDPDPDGAPATPEAPHVERSRHVAAPPATVWRVLADRDSRRHVLGGDLDVDLVEGAEGTWRPREGDPSPVRVHRVDADRRLAFDWGRGGDAATVEIDLRPVRTGTAVRVVETRRGAITAPRMQVGDVLCLAA